MIDLTAKDIEEFRAIHERETGRRITEAQAREYALSLIRLVDFVLREDPPNSDPPDL
jgi:hypothetical protein